jgi:hypothetical protein
MTTLTGDWQIQIHFLLGETRHAARLEQEGETLQGRYRSQYGEHEIQGRIAGDAVELQVGIHHQRCGTTYAFRGTVAGDAMHGEVGLGEYGRARWEARRRG